jgi:hypothetical protein
LFHSGPAHPLPSDLRELGSVLEKWHKDIPQPFTASSLERGESRSILSLAIQATSLQYQLIFFQELALRADRYDESLMTWSHRKKTRTAFDLAAVFRLATVHDLARLAPPSLFVPPQFRINTNCTDVVYSIDCAAQLASTQAKTARDPNSEKGVQLAAMTDVQILLAYLEECGQSRSYARWFYEGLSDALRRAGILA